MVRAELLTPRSLISACFCLFVLGGATAASAAVESATQPATRPALPPGMTAYDWTVIVAYGVGLLAVGWYYARRTRTTEDYLLGGRSMRAGSVGLSLFATLLSTITYLAIPGEMIKHGPVILWSIAAIPIAYVVVGYLLIPPFMKLKVTSAYEILEVRLGVRIRLLGSVIFLMTRLLWMALIIYLTSDKIVVPIFGWSENIIIPLFGESTWELSPTTCVAVIIGLVTVVYTSMGGLRAVVFTDVVQSFILLGGAILAITVITVKMGGFSWWPTEWATNWSHQPVFWRPPCPASRRASIPPAR